MVVGEMFNVLKKSMESDMEKVMLPLILKSGDTNKFLREDCNVALDAIVENCSPQKLILIVTAELVILFYNLTKDLLCLKIEVLGGLRIWSKFLKL